MWKYSMQLSQKNSKLVLMAFDVQRRCDLHREVERRAIETELSRALFLATQKIEQYES